LAAGGGGGGGGGLRLRLRLRLHHVRGMRSHAWVLHGHGSGGMLRWHRGARRHSRLHVPTGDTASSLHACMRCDVAGSSCCVVMRRVRMS
jgi:hypothetical protein